MKKMEIISRINLFIVKYAEQRNLPTLLTLHRESVNPVMVTLDDDIILERVRNTPEFKKCHSLNDYYLSANPDYAFCVRFIEILLCPEDKRKEKGEPSPTQNHLKLINEMWQNAISGKTDYLSTSHNDWPNDNLRP